MAYSLEQSLFFFFLTIISYSYTGKKKSGGNLSRNKQKRFKFLRGKLHSIMKDTGRDTEGNLLSDDHPQLFSESCKREIQRQLRDLMSTSSSADNEEIPLILYLGTMDIFDNTELIHCSIFKEAIISNHARLL